MPGTRSLVPSAPALLRREHELLEELFRLYGNLGDGAEGARKLRIYLEIRRRLERHAAAESLAFYPAVERAGTAGAGGVADALGELRAMESILERLEREDPDDSAFDDTMRRLRETVEGHARRDEALLFPLFERLPREEREGASRGLTRGLEEPQAPREPGISIP